MLNKFKSIRLKLLLVFLPGALVALLASFYFASFKAEEEFSERLADKQNHLASYAVILAKPLWRFDIDGVKNIALAMQQDPDVLKITIRDEGGYSIYHYQAEDVAEANPTEINYPLIYDNDSIQQQAGVLEISLGQRSLNEHKEELFKATLIAFMLFMSALLAGVWLAFSRLLGTPIQTLINAINSSHKEDHFAKITLDTNDELSQIADALNSMQSRLQASHLRLEKNQQHLKNLYHSTPSLLFSFDQQGVIQDASDYFITQLHFRKEEILGRQLQELLFDEAQSNELLDGIISLWKTGRMSRFAFDLRSGGGEKIEVLMDAILSENSSFPGALAVISDVTKLNQARKKLETQANTDALSGIANRYNFQHHLQTLIDERQTNDQPFALLFIDLDHFKTINDTFGHQAGDDLIRFASQRIEHALRPGDKLARLGGDEFAITLGQLSSDKEAARIAQRILYQFDESFQLAGSNVYVSVSIGISLFPFDSRSPVKLLQNADFALYRAKDAGRRGFAFYQKDLDVQDGSRLVIESLLREALDKKLLTIQYQPIVDIQAGRVCGVEALLRLKHGDALISPEEFIPVAEEIGMIVPISEWCIQQSCQYLQSWKQSCDLADDFYMSINISTRQFQAASFIECIQQALQDYQIPPCQLMLEITESLLLQKNQHNLFVFEQLESLGCKIAIDDFGTGFSALSYLINFPVKVLKIDRSFIRKDAEEQSQRRLVEAIIQMSHSMQLQVVAEGIETKQQFLWLRGLSEDLSAQGYYFSEPIASQEFVHNYPLLEVQVRNACRDLDECSSL